MIAERTKPADSVIDIPSQTIYVTNDYDKFRINPANRPVPYGAVMLLVDKIRRKNLLADSPINVQRQTMLVLDGETRLRAAQFLGIPIYYKWSVDMDETNIASFNSVARKWTPADYLHHFVVLGYPEYIKLKQFKDTYPFISLAQCKVLCSTVGGGKPEWRDNYNNGFYTNNRIPWGVRVAETALTFRPYHKKIYKHRVFIAAVAILVNEPRYDHSRMMHKLQDVSTRFVTCQTTKEYIALLNGIYNYRAKSRENRLTFTTRHEGHPDDE